MKSFIVICQHNTGHGLNASIVLSTEQLVTAIDVAKGIESYGYEFHGTEAFVGVMETENNKVYPKKDFKYYGPTPINYPLLFVASKPLPNSSQLFETWLRKDLQNLYEKEKELVKE